MARASRRHQPDDELLFGSRTENDTLSRISEGSNEASNITSSTYFSATSSSTPAGLAARGAVTRDFLTTAGALRLLSPGAAPASPLLPRSPKQRASPRVVAASGASAGAGGAPAHAAEGTSGSRSQASGSGGGPSQDPDVIKKTVKAFVEAGVRGRRLEVLRRDGQLQQVTFRLSRQVDSFEIAPEGGRTSHTVSLNEVAAVYTGDDVRAQGELAASLPGLDGNTAVVDLCDGRCLAFRFLEASPRREAETFAHCMQIFAQEVSRERSGMPAKTFKDGTGV